MKLRLLFLLGFTFMLVSCSSDESPEDRLEDPVVIELTDDIVLEAIETFKSTLYDLGATNFEETETAFKPVFLSHNDDELIQDFVENPWNFSIDLEWLDMSVIVLDFSEEIVNAEYEFGTEVNVNDLTVNQDTWGWNLYEDTTVILDYIDETLFLQVKTLPAVSTFYFDYNEDDMITILRIEENIHEGEYSVNVEDFVERNGLSMWQSIGYYSLFTTYNTNDNSHTLYSTTDTELHHNNSILNINGIDVYFSKLSETEYTALFDLYHVGGFDDYIDGTLYLEGEEIAVQFEINEYLLNDFGHFTLLANKTLSNDEDTFAIPELQFESEITLADILQEIEEAYVEYDYSMLYTDYTADSESVLLALNEYSYYDYEAE